MDTEENGGKERRSLARDLLGHADPRRWTAVKGISQASMKRPGLFPAQSSVCRHDSIDPRSIMEEPIIPRVQAGWYRHITIYLVPKVSPSSCGCDLLPLAWILGGCPCAENIVVLPAPWALPVLTAESWPLQTHRLQRVSQHQSCSCQLKSRSVFLTCLSTLWSSLLDQRSVRRRRAASAAFGQELGR